MESTPDFQSAEFSWDQENNESHLILPNKTHLFLSQVEIVKGGKSGDAITTFAGYDDTNRVVVVEVMTAPDHLPEVLRVTIDETLTYEVQKH